MLRRSKAALLNALLILGATATQSLASELSLISDSSEIRYQVAKYGTMLVQGVLTDPTNNGLSGKILISQRSDGLALSGDIVLMQAIFDSQHARRDDEVNKLFLTPIRVAVSNSRPCLVRSGECLVDGVLDLNNRTQKHEISVRFDKEQSRLLIEGTFIIQREPFNLVFTEGFAGTLDMAVAQDVTIDFRLPFAVNDLSMLDDVPVKLGSNAVESEVSTLSWSDRLKRWAEELWN